MRKTTQGYTLIEVVIALAIFAILGTLSVGLLSRAFDTKARLATQIEPLSEITLAATRIKQSASQIVARPVRDQDMNKIPAFVANTNQIEFTRGGFIQLEQINQAPKKSTLRRMALSCDGSNLIQSTWSVLDGFDQEAPQKQVLLSHLKSCSFAFPASHKTWSDAWRGDENTTPSAFKLYLNFKDLGEIALIFQIPGGIEID